MVAGVIFAVSVVGAALLSRGPNSEPLVPTTVLAVSSTTSSTSTTLPTASQPSRGIDGFGESAMSVKAPTGEEKKFCAALASTSAQQARGMKNQDDFGGYDAMVFPFEQDSNAAFYMSMVRIPLTVVFVDAAGAFISSSQMAPCSLADSACQRYPAARPFRMAIEVTQGAESVMNLGPGSVVTVGGPCA